MDVQSKFSDSFTQDQINILQTMADQIAIAIENSLLYQESIRRLEELAESNRKQTQRAWQDYIHYQRQRQIISQAGVSSIPLTEYETLRQTATRTGKPAIGELTHRDTVPFAVPIQLRGQTLGAVQWELPEADFTHDKVLLAQELVNRLAISLDNARLFQESQRAIERERLVNDIAAKLTGQTDIDQILEVAVREVGQALRAPEVIINLSLQKEDDENGK
ncbi:MAG: hypothetical protein CUN56_02790 [Phototrophicales bacterium]|nr:MAG: hypothetical protein CUN56_02790 [Phototrophicales bacterium]